MKINGVNWGLLLGSIAAAICVGDSLRHYWHANQWYYWIPLGFSAIWGYLEIDDMQTELRMLRHQVAYYEREESLRLDKDAAEDFD